MNMFNAPMNYELTDDVEIFPFFSASNTSNHRQAYLNRTKVITLAHIVRRESSLC